MLLIKIKDLETTLKYMNMFKTILTFSNINNDKNSNTNKKESFIETIDTAFNYLPEYEIYFECFGYPTCPNDYLRIDQDQLNMIRKELKKKSHSVNSNQILG
jgi:hypothetical protein